MTGNRGYLLTYIGVILLAVGAMAPLAKLPIVGSFSYYDLARPEVYFLLAFAALGPALIFINRQVLAPVSALGVWVVLLWPTLKNLGGGDSGGGGGSKLLDRVIDVARAPAEKYADQIFSHLDELSWGGYVFLGGVLVLTLGTLMTAIAARKG